MRGKVIFLGGVCLLVSALLLSCKPALQKGEVSSDEFTASMIANVRPMDRLKCKSEVQNGSGGVKLTWTAVSRADSYLISRRDQGAKDWKLLDTLSSEHTYYVDQTVKTGKTYEYMVEAPCEYNDTDRFAYDVSQMPDILTDQCSIYTGVGDARWTEKLPEKKKIKQGSVMLEYAFGSAKQGGVIPEGIEIYRKGSTGDYTLLERGLVSDHRSGEYDFGKNYIDHTVEQGRIYYYQIRAYAMIGGERVYGKKSKPLKVLSAEPEGIYTVRVVREPDGYHNNIILAVTSAQKENGLLTLAASDMKEKVSFLYRKVQSIYTTELQSSASPEASGSPAGAYTSPYCSKAFVVSRYSNDGHYFNSVVSDIILEPEKTVYLELSPTDVSFDLPNSYSLEKAAYFLPARYNEGKHSLQIDIKNAGATLIDPDSGGMMTVWAENMKPGKVQMITLGMVSSLRENKRITFSASDLQELSYQYQGKTDDSLQTVQCRVAAYSQDGIHWKKPNGTISLQGQETIYWRVVPVNRSNALAYCMKGQRHADLSFTGRLAGKKEWSMNVDLLKNKTITNG